MTREEALALLADRIAYGYCFAIGRPDQAQPHVPSVREALEALTTPSVPTRGGGVSHPIKHEATSQEDGASPPGQTGPGSSPPKCPTCGGKGIGWTNYCPACAPTDDAAAKCDHECEWRAACRDLSELNLKLTKKLHGLEGRGTFGGVPDDDAETEAQGTERERLVEIMVASYWSRNVVPPIDHRQYAPSVEDFQHVADSVLAYQAARRDGGGECEGDCRAARLHADINRRSAEALGKPHTGPGSSWHDIPEEIARLKARGGE